MDWYCRRRFFVTSHPLNYRYEEEDMPLPSRSYFNQKNYYITKGTPSGGIVSPNSPTAKTLNLIDKLLKLEIGWSTAQFLMSIRKYLLNYGSLTAKQDEVFRKICFQYGVISNDPSSTSP
jgi:hypothetical protein